MITNMIIIDGKSVVDGSSNGLDNRETAFQLKTVENARPNLENCQIADDLYEDDNDCGEDGLN